MTTGFLQEHMISNKLEIETAFTHIVLDEIHDRDIETDFVLLMMRILLLRKSKIKLVLMSATLDPKLLTDYLEKFAINGFIPIIECRMRIHWVKQNFLDDLEVRLNFRTSVEFDINSPEISDQQLEILVKLLDFIDKKEVNQIQLEF